MSRTLQTLFDYLDNLDARAPLEELEKQLASIDIKCADVAEFIRFSERGYMRNLVRAGPWYNVLVLCWKNGQRSPIHDHAGSTCAVRVLRGVATETVFDFAPNGQVWATCSRSHRPGSVVGSQDSDLHQVSNLQEGDADLVTMHVYTPPLMWMGTYSLTDNTRGQEPMFVEFYDAAGI
ncbi:MAG TPA: cysteine dioxygenase family protein [Gemmataceae bacterium]|nr:cysteine dioxygenase family protein [Gemmataceae bacterium]